MSVAVALEPDGRIVVAGYYLGQPQASFELIRFLATGPQIGSFTASPTAMIGATNLTLAASNFTDPNPGATITQVAFYLDSNTDGKLEAGDTLLGYGFQTSTGVWTLTFSTTAWAPGTYTLFAQAEDNFGVFGDPFAMTLIVN
jgi:hypothetical protein